MEYLKSVLGIRVEYSDSRMPNLPNYIYTRYRLQEVLLDGRKVVFVYPKIELEAINVVKKHLERIEHEMGEAAVLLPERLTYRQKEYLLREHIPFIVDGKQIYLPFMAVYLQERSGPEKAVRIDMLPSAQLLLLYYIYQGCGEQLTSEAAKSLSITATSISRACRQLEDFRLIQSEKRGVQKVIYSDKGPQELFENAKEYLLKPVKRTIYVSRADIKEKFLLSGYSALAGYSMLNPPALEYYAAESIAALEKTATGKLQNSNDQCAVELWRYDPKKLAELDKATEAERVDRLSLALALKDVRDERIEEAIDEMLEDVWKEINGKRNKEIASERYFRRRRKTGEKIFQY